MNPVPDNYYTSEASYAGSDGIEESQHLHFQGVSDDDHESSSSKENSPPGVLMGPETQLGALLDFQEMFAHTPPWLRAERAGMDPISPWRETCDIPPSQRPPPARQQGTHAPRSPGSPISPTPPDTLLPAMPSTPGVATLSPAPHTPPAQVGSSSQRWALPPVPSASVPMEYHCYYYSRPDCRTPLGTLYEQDCDDQDSVDELPVAAGRRVLVDVACSTDQQPEDRSLATDELQPTAREDVSCSTYANPTLPQHQRRDVECQTEPQDEIIPEWLDKTVVERELREGRDERLKAYIKRFRHSVAAEHVDHRRAFIFHPPPAKQQIPATPLQKRAAALSISDDHSGRPQFARATKEKAKDKIKSWYQDGAALDSQTDSQAWLDGALMSSQTPASALPLGRIVAPTPAAQASSTTYSPSTPIRAGSSITAASSPFVVWGMTPAVDTSPSRFTTELSKLTVMCGTARRSPRELSFADLDALLEYQTKLNALLTEDLVVTHAKLFAMEDKFKAYSIHYGFPIDH